METALKTLKIINRVINQKSYRSRISNYITTPIFYVNAKPHLGHFYSMTLADVQNRWMKLNNKPSFFTTGTDEHGLKVQNAAALAKVEPKLFCDQLSDKFKDLAKVGDIEYDRFIRTTDGDHLAAVNEFWKTVWDKGYIYKGTHSGWYSISDECFYPETDIMKSEELDTKTGEYKMVSKETGSEVIFETEENYFFKLSQFQDKIIEMLESNPDFIQPKAYYTTILKDLKTNKLSDLSVSRPTWRLQWGITVPNDPDQKIYVWFDALVNYITSIGYPAAVKAMDGLPPMTHLIGKDITKFHCVHWPAFLMAAGIPIPAKVIVHGHWLMDGRKMSKSRGNVVDPIEIVSTYDADSLRLFLMKYSVLESDGDFSEEELKFTRNEFIGKFANLLTRSLSKNFNITRALERLETDSIDQLLSELNENVEFNNDILEIHSKVNDLHNDINENFNNLEMHKAIQKIWSLAPKLNSMFDRYAPWHLRKSTNNTDSQSDLILLRQDLIIFTALDSLRCLLILLQPVIPNYSKILLDRLKVGSNRRSVRFSKIASDLSYGRNSTFAKGTPAPIRKIK